MAEIVPDELPWGGGHDRVEAQTRVSQVAATRMEELRRVANSVGGNIS